LAAAERSATAPAWLNAANEIAVAAFLERRIGYLAIPAIIDAVMAKADIGEATSLEAVLQADQAARRYAEGLLPKFAC
jgi:1-deoxy-D-xylulose-5-phosphate reductoisomerase